MFVVKRNGKRAPVDFNKITHRIQKLCTGLGPGVDPICIAQRVVDGLYAGVKTSQLDDLAAETAASWATVSPDYDALAARILASNLMKNIAVQCAQTDKKKNIENENENSSADAPNLPDNTDFAGVPLGFYRTMQRLHSHAHAKTKRAANLIPAQLLEVAFRHADKIDGAIDYARNLSSYSYAGLKTLIRSYLLRIDDEVAECPQTMLMRVSLGIHFQPHWASGCSDLDPETEANCIDEAVQTYEMMSKGIFTHASPTLFNSGTPRPQMSSCFLMALEEDSIDGIYSTLKKVATISKNAGGIGISVHNIRAKGSYIGGTNGSSNGLVPMLRVFNDTARYVDQGGGKRKGAFAVYLEPWHADVFDFLELRKNHGKEELRARDLFYALWVNDLFMERVEADGQWSLFCPHEAPGLAEVWGAEFDALYAKYERTPGLAKRVVKAQALWQALIESQIETGTPYMLYKDSCNRKSNHSHLGTIASSNLCTEIVQYTEPKKEIAVCNLASIALPKFVRLAEYPETSSADSSSCGDSSYFTLPEFDHEGLRTTVHHMVKNLNRVIDGNFYPLEETRTSNLRHRPLGLGVQGLADVFMLMDVAFESAEARVLNREIFETIYFAALEMSCDLARQDGPHESYDKSPVSRGVLQMDMWDAEGKAPPTVYSGRWDWAGLRRKIAAHGVRNSLLVAPMPTASTSQILGNNECFEPYTSNIYTRRLLSGEFSMVNRHLVRQLSELGLWSVAMKDEIVARNGSVQGIAGIPRHVKDVFKTASEMKMKSIIDMAVDRAPFVDQSQSLNVFMDDPTFKKLSSLHFYAWKRGLKTGMYYLRTQAAMDAVKVTIDPMAARPIDKAADGKAGIDKAAEGRAADGNADETCVSCSG